MIDWRALARNHLSIMNPDDLLKNPPEQVLGERDEPGLARFLTSGRTFFAVVLLATGISIALGALSEDRAPFSHDAEIYMRVIRLFDQGITVDLLRTYDGEPASPAPLFFMVYAWYGKMVGFSWTAFRGLSLAITLLATTGLWVFLRNHASCDWRDHFPLLLFLFPYVFCMAFSVMAEPLTMLLTVLGLCFSLHGLTHKSHLSFLAGSIAIAAALHVRIHAAFVPAALIAVLLLRRERSPLRWSLAVAPILLRVPLIFLQGGLTVSREAFAGAKPELGFCPSNLNFFFVWLGYSFFPLLWWCVGRRWVNCAATLALIPFYVLAAPDFLGAEHGGALRTLLLKSGLSLTSGQWLMFPAWLAGCYLTTDLAQRIIGSEDLQVRLSGLCIMMFAMSLVFSTVAFERYYQLAVPAIVLLGVAKTRRPGPYLAMAACHALFFFLSMVRLAADVR